MKKLMRCRLGCAMATCLLVVALHPAAVRGQTPVDKSSAPLFPDWPVQASGSSTFARVLRDEESNDALGQYFRVRPPDAEGRLIQAITLLDQKEYRQAWTPLNAATEAEPDRKELYPIRAFLRCQLMKHGDDNALSWAEGDLRKGYLWPKNGFPTGVKGCIALRRGQHQFAINDFTWAIDHGADLDEFRICRAFTFMKLRKWHEAIPDLDQVARHDPSDSRALECLCICHSQLDEWELALDDMDRILELRPRDVQARVNRLILALEHKNYDVVLTDVEKLLVQRPDLSFALLYLRSITLWAAGKDFALVKADLDRAIKLEPREWTMHAFRAYLNSKQTRYAAALGDLVLTGLAMNHETFSIFWKCEKSDDGRDRFYLGVHWRIVERDGQPKKPAASPGPGTQADRIGHGNALDAGLSLNDLQRPRRGKANKPMLRRCWQALSGEINCQVRRTSAMATMNISLPDEMKAFVEDQASEMGFGTVSEYVRAIIREVQERHKERERLDALLLEGLDSGPASPLTKADWDHIRREGTKLIAKRKRGRG